MKIELGMLQVPGNMVDLAGSVESLTKEMGVLKDWMAYDGVSLQAVRSIWKEIIKEHNIYIKTNYTVVLV